MQVTAVLDNLYTWTSGTFVNRLFKSLVQVHHKYYIVWYPYGITWYKMIVPRNRKPCMVDQIYAGDENVTADIRQYMGPYHNFHGQQVTPKMLGYSELRFTYIDDSDHTFVRDDPISL